MQMSSNRPFPSFPGRLYQNEVKCSAFDMQMSFHSHAKNSFSQERLCTWPYFESEGFWNSEVAYSFVAHGDRDTKGNRGVCTQAKTILHFIILQLRHTVQDFSLILQRFSYDLEMKTREQNRNNKRTEIERFDWSIERIQTRLAFGWLSERSLEKLSRNQAILRFDVILQHDRLIEQCLLHIWVFFGGKMKRPCFDLFIHRLIKQITNKVIRKSLYCVLRESVGPHQVMYINFIPL